MLSEAINQFSHFQSDLEHARRIEPFFDLFRLFAINHDETITMSLAAIRTLARETTGSFTKEEADETLSYLTPHVRTRVFRTLFKYGWITSNGIRYELPERVRSVVLFLYSALIRDPRDFAQDMDVSFALTDLDEASGNEEELSTGNFEMSIGTLRNILAQLLRVLEQKSPNGARDVLFKSERNRQAIQRIEKRLAKRNRVRYQYSLTSEVRSLCADILNLHQDIITFIHQDIQANAKSFGTYLTPEQVEEFLHQAPLDLLAQLIKKHFASPREILFMPKEEMVIRGFAYLQRKPITEQPTLPPPVVPMKTRQVVVHRQEGHAQELYQDLMHRLIKEETIPLPRVVLKDTFGETVFRTGLLTQIRNELSFHPDKLQFDIILEDSRETFDEGPVKEMTKGFVRLSDRTVEEQERDQ